MVATETGGLFGGQYVLLLRGVDVGDKEQLVVIAVDLLVVTVLPC